MLEMDKYDFTKIVLGTIFSFYNVFKQENIKTEVDIDEEPVVVVCNDIAVKRLLSNLLKNAVLHGNGMVSVKYKVKSSCVEFICRNSIRNPKK